MTLRLQTLGALRLFAADEIIAETRKELVLLAYLARLPGRAVGRAQLATLLWGDRQEERARHSLRQALVLLKRWVGEALIVTNNEVKLDPALISCDVVQLEQRVRDHDPDAVLELWHGHFLASAEDLGGEEFREWLEAERTRLGKFAETAFEQSFSNREQGGDAAAMLHIARGWTEAFPFSEQAHTRLVQAYYRVGNVYAALAAHDEFTTRLQRELGDPPSDVFAAMRAEIEQARPAAKLVLGVPRRARNRRIAIGLIAVSALLGIGAFAVRRNGSVTIKQAVVVFPFSIQGNPAPAYLREGLVDLLSTKLDGAGALRSIDPHASISTVRGRATALAPDEARALAEKLGGEFYVLGNALQTGETLRITASLYDPARGEQPIAVAGVEGDAEQVLPLVDQLAVQLLGKLSARSGARLASTAAQTTNSLPALKAYLTGERLLRAADEEGALKSFELAAQLDTTFALADYRVTIAAEWFGRPHQAYRALDRATRHMNKLSERDHLLLNARRAQMRGAAEDAERLYKTLLGTYSDDVEGWIQLGETLFHYGPLRAQPISAARAAFERAVALDPDNLHALVHLARIAAREGVHDDVARYVNRISELSGESTRTWEVMSLKTYSIGTAEERATFVERNRTTSDFYLLHGAWGLAVTLQELKTADELARLIPDIQRSASVRANGHLFVAWLSAARGRLRDARAQIALATSLDSVMALETEGFIASVPFLPISDPALNRVRTRLQDFDATVVAKVGLYDVLEGIHPLIRSYLLGLIAARSNEANAERIARQTELTAGPQFAPELPHDLAGDIRARVALTRGERRGAADKLQRDLVPRWYSVAYRHYVYSQAYERYLLAELLRAEGRDAEALPLYQSFAHQDVPDLIFYAPGMLRAAQIYQQLGDRKNARAAYQKFITAWGDADPELQPEVARARKELLAL